MSSESALHPTRAAADASLPDRSEPVNKTVEELFTRCQERVSRYLVQLVRDRELAADLLQDTFHDALTDQAQLLAALNPEAWLFGIARNRGLRALRRRQRFDRALRRLGARQLSNHDDAEVIAVHDLLAQVLSPSDRSLILLRYLYDFETSELAEMTGLSASAVRQRLSRACASLRKAESSRGGSKRGKHDY